MNDGFSFDSSIAWSDFFRVAWVHRWWSPEVQQNVKKELAHVHEQSEFTYGAYLVAAGHLYSIANYAQLSSHVAFCLQLVLSRFNPDEQALVCLFSRDILT